MNVTFLIYVTGVYTIKGKGDIACLHFNLTSWTAKELVLGYYTLSLPSLILQICLFNTFYSKCICRQKSTLKKAKKLCFMRQIVIESFSFLEY